MIISIIIGRAGSKGFPKKNIKKVLGRRLCEYSMIASTKSKFIDKTFVATDCKIISTVAKKYGIEKIIRPKRFNDSKALGEDVFKFSYDQAKKKLNLLDRNIKYIVLLFANSPVTTKLIDKGINILNKNKKFDSAVSTSVYNMWSPLRARKLTKKGNLVPFVNFNYFGDPKKLNCDRDSQGNVYYADMSVSVVRPSCLTQMKKGLLPQKWMGKFIAPIFSEAGGDLDYSWQLPNIEYWLKKNGFKIKR